MKKTIFFSLWVGLYILCALLGLIPSPGGALRVVMTVLSVLFFLPPTLLFLESKKTGDKKTLKLLRLLSILSLGGTLLLFVFNILAVAWPEALGNALYVLLNFVSAPMVCSGYYVISLFLWACLLFMTLKVTPD